MPRMIRHITWEEAARGKDEDSRQAKLWGGVLTFEEKSDILFSIESGVTHPIRVTRTHWHGRATYRRPSDAVRQFERAYNIYFVRHGRISFHNANLSVEIGDGEFALQMPNTAYVMNVLTSDREGWRCCMRGCPSIFSIPSWTRTGTG